MGPRAAPEAITSDLSGKSEAKIGYFTTEKGNIFGRKSIGFSRRNRGKFHSENQPVCDAMIPAVSGQKRGTFIPSSPSPDEKGIREKGQRGALPRSPRSRPRRASEGPRTPRKGAVRAKFGGGKGGAGCPQRALRGRIWAVFAAGGHLVPQSEKTPVLAALGAHVRPAGPLGRLSGFFPSGGPAGKNFRQRGGRGAPVDGKSPPKGGLRGTRGRGRNFRKRAVAEKNFAPPAAGAGAGFANFFAKSPRRRFRPRFPPSGEIFPPAAPMAESTPIFALRGGEKRGENGLRKIK